MSIKSTAESLIGKVKYVFGGGDIEGGKGDCSDFTQYVFEKNGYQIGGTTEEQYKQGKEVSKSDLQEGDLIFFKDTYDSRYTDGVSHVGIYVGDGKFIHNSSGAGGVTTSKLDSDYYNEHWLGARRVTDGSEGSEGSETSKTTNLIWWGDIVKVVVIALLIILGVFLIYYSMS